MCEDIESNTNLKYSCVIPDQLSDVLEQMHEEDSDSLFADGFDSCIIGLDMKTSVVVYDYYKIINLLISHGMSQEEALEYAEYNILGAYVGEKTPIFINVVQNNLKEI